jgi:hypothetical protein
MAEINEIILVSDPMEELLELVKTQTSLIETLTKEVTNLSLKTTKLSKDINYLKDLNKMKKIVEKTDLKDSYVKIIEESGKITVTGDAKITFKIKEVLKGNGAKWNKKAWEFTDKSVEEVQKFVNNGLELFNITANVIV